ncbi:Chitin-inducible gibberellin-responsive protein, putative [Ricinus communis]|uniref:Chitin-inducible gibberellin-responsive protein, putative n=1 Tax=Ricinus communis TaxID=3988 RepID=B9S9Z5_RICCO|nr:Chitin-inducible gibberellin-responsive protein, putative [Ricinus communis]
MESHPLFRYSSVTGAGISYSSSYPIAPSIPNRLSGPFQFAIGNSPNSPFSNQFDCDTITTLSDSTEQYSPTENLSGASPSCNSSLESNNYFHHRSPSLLQDANSGQNIKHRLLQLETALMGPDDEDISMPNNALGESSRPQTSGQRTRAWCQERQGSRVIQPQPSFVSRQRQACEGSSVEKYHKGIEETGLQSIPPDNLKQLLIACAKALSENNINEFDRLIEKARAAVSISGEPIQRLGAYLVEGLVARKESSGNNIYHALRCREPESKDLLSYMQILYEICPYLKFGCELPLAASPHSDESVDVSNPRDGLLRMIKSLNPKVVTLVEQESNTNTTPFLTRFMETLDFYLAMFESIDVRLPRERKDRIGVEQHCLAKDIVNIIACEGKERVERHELFGKWKSRLTMAGFRQYPLSSYVNSVIRSLLRCYSEHYTLLEKDGAMLLGWKNRNLVSASAWY